MLKHLFNRFFQEIWPDYDRHCTHYRLKGTYIFFIFSKEWRESMYRLRLGDLTLELGLDEDSFYPRFDLGIDWPRFSFTDIHPGIAVEDFRAIACLPRCRLMIQFFIYEVRIETRGYDEYDYYFDEDD